VIDTAEPLGADKPAGHSCNAAPHAYSFATHLAVGRLLFGDTGRPELATGVLERVMREMNRRTDVEVRWSTPGASGMLMVKLAGKYHHGRLDRWTSRPGSSSASGGSLRPPIWSPRRRQSSR